jgi:hypothetical protein
MALGPIVPGVPRTGGAGRRMTSMTVTMHTTNLLTANQRLHWAAKAQTTRTLRLMGAWAAKEQGIPVMDRAHLTVWVSWPDHRRRDVANISPTLKALIDGIVQDAKRLPDDDDRHLIGPDLRVTDEVSGLKGVTRLRFEFEELGQ